ncbi:hypothetical protein ACHAXR_006677 [Thalassiosira sp. AJA248-18]
MVKFTLLSCACCVALSLQPTFTATAHETTTTTADRNNNNAIILEDEEEGSPHNNNSNNNNSEPTTAPRPVVCSHELNAYCPPNTTCCPKYSISSSRYSSGSKSSSSSPRSSRHYLENDDDIVGYSCLMSWSSRVAQGPCCADDYDEDDDAATEEEASKLFLFGSGCAAGYTCAAPIASSTSAAASSSSSAPSSFLQHEPHCQRNDHHNHHHDSSTSSSTPNEYERMPRYLTCPAFAMKDIATPYGLPIPLSAATTANNKLNDGGVSPGEKHDGDGDVDVDDYMGQLAYFTNMGPLLTAASSTTSLKQPSQQHQQHQHHHANVTTAVIGIHGSGRDAGSYLCAMIAATAAVPTVKKEEQDGSTATTASTANKLVEKKMDQQPPLEVLEKSFINDKKKLLLHLDDASNNVRSTLRRSRRQRRHRRVQNDDKKGITATTETDTEKKQDEQILVIAPWFLAPADGQPDSSSSPSSSSSLPFLQWVDDAPIEHTFRYGAESIDVPVSSSSSTMTTISSYGAMDVLLETLCNKTNYPNLERIVIAGHSAGGQFVHRWGLSSDSWCFGDNYVGDDGDGDDDDYDSSDAASSAAEEEEEEGHTNLDNNLPSIRVVAANPRSYAYLDERRYFPTDDDAAAAVAVANMGLMDDKGKVGEEDKNLSPFNQLDFRSPTTSELDDCQEYNRYCWGLEDNPDLPAPYITNNVNKLIAKNGGGGDNGDDDDVNNTDDLFCRYASRDIVYLSGQRDTKQLGNQICDEDGYQGPSRRERSERFYASLQIRGDEIRSSCLRSRHQRDGDVDAVMGGVEGGEERGGKNGNSSRLFVAEMSRAKGGFCSRHMKDENVQVHGRIVVKNVGHDHALIFQSKEGREGMFSDSSF